MVNLDGKRKKTVNTTYFWNAFLPILLFMIVGGILFFVMKTPDEILPASSADFVLQGTRNVAKNIMRNTNN